ncbi:MAG TPA: nuclear transport factor 2 family protein [Acidimicrobiales bacterium]|nr:nuclear transport factor 2 family protein [Acidimicrobiales bacterium]
MSDPAVQELLDKEAIRQAVLRYCRGVDRADEELLASAYHPDAVDHHGATPLEGAAIAPGILVLVGKSTASLHQITNQFIQVQGPDVAAAETYFTAWQGMEFEGAERMLLAIGRYVDRFEKRDGEWRIADRLVIVEHTRLLPAEGVFPASQPGLGRRDRDDPSYQVLGL